MESKADCNKQLNQQFVTQGSKKTPSQNSKKKKIFLNEDSFGDLWDNICIVVAGEERSGEYI